MHASGAWLYGWQTGLAVCSYPSFQGLAFLVSKVESLRDLSRNPSLDKTNVGISPPALPHALVADYSSYMDVGCCLDVDLWGPANGRGG